MTEMLSPQDASVPGAVRAFQRAPERAYAYRWPTRLADRWAGWRDRGPVRAGSVEREVPNVAVSPWLTRLAHEHQQAMVRERRSTEALLSVLERRAAALQARLGQLLERRRVTRERLEEMVDAGPQEDRRSAAEQYASADEIQRRRARELADRVAQASAGADQIDREHDQIVEQLAELDSEKAAHLRVLALRLEYIVERYGRRAGTYCRALERRRRGELFEVPELRVPDPPLTR